MGRSVVIMGVAGCGKSSLGAVLAQRTGVGLIEGDDYHSAQSREKMRRGIALTDDDRDGWLSGLAELLRDAPDGAVLSASALKRAYRDRLRAAVADLRFIFLEISREEALRRVSARAGEHFFPGGLVDSQFATLEPPLGEAGVLALDARLALSELEEQAAVWLGAEEKAGQGASRPD